MELARQEELLLATSKERRNHTSPTQEVTSHDQGAQGKQAFPLSPGS